MPKGIQTTFPPRDPCRWPVRRERQRQCLVVLGCVVVVRRRRWQVGGLETDLQVTAYGQSTVDLSATGAEVDVFTVFGETELIVPGDWNVISDHGAIAGALERRGADLPENPKGTIHLGGVTLFGATILIRAE